MRNAGYPQKRKVITGGICSLCHQRGTRAEPVVEEVWYVPGPFPARYQRRTGLRCHDSIACYLRTLTGQVAGANNL